MTTFHYYMLQMLPTIYILDINLDGVYDSIYD